LFRAVLSAALVAGALVVTPVAAADEVVGSTFTSTSPVRVLDTRTGGPVGAGGTVVIDLASRVPATATAVVLNVTGVAPTASTFVTAYPGGAPRPTASSLNLDAGEVRANQVTVALGADRTVRLYNNSGRINLVADLAGHYGTEAGSLFTGLPPNRVLDTRADYPVPGGGVRVLDLSGAVPESATAVTFNLTAVQPTGSTFVTAWPTGAPRPTASNLNVEIGDTRPNLVTVAVGENRTVSLYNNFGNVHLLADLTGFYTPGYGARFVPRTPQRVLDTRADIGLPGPLEAGGLGHTLGLAATVPVTTTGVVLNVTGVAATASTYVTVWGEGTSQPYQSSTLNLVPGAAVPNAATVAFSQYRGLSLYNHRGTTELVADLSGAFVVSPEDCAPGCVRAWGDNFTRKLGTGHTVSASPAPTPVVGLSGARQVVGGDSASYAVLDDGTVRAWGGNDSGQLGNGWSARNSASAVPVPVVGLTGVTAVSTNGRTTYALRSDGTVWGWGQGPFGTGGYEVSNVPMPLPHLTGVTEIAVGGGTTYALRSDGTVWAWGANDHGELGVGRADDNAVLAPVRVLSDVDSIGAGAYNGYAVTSDGTAWAWGMNVHGQLGDGEPCSVDPTVACESRVPVRVTGLGGVARVVGGDATTYALRADGTVAAWGLAVNGALGTGSECSGNCVVRTPVDVAGLTGVTSVASFGWGGYALRGDGTVWAWGDNGFASLGNDVTVVALAPVRVQGVADVTAIGGGLATGYAIS
jgi:alpha-tubulin suppressor-like RCC1 family protein